MGSIDIYLMSLFKCPETVLKRLESIRARFFGGGNISIKKMAWVKWEKVISPFDKGGLNVGSLKAFNLALIYKCRWRYLTNPNDMWVSIIKSIHGNSLEDVNSASSSVWTNIVQTCSMCIDKELLPSNIFPYVDREPLGKVANKIANGVWQFNWYQAQLRGRIDQLFREMIESIDVPVLREQPDNWPCMLNNEGAYTVKDARIFIDRFKSLDKFMDITVNFVLQSVDGSILSVGVSPPKCDV
ncbi:uncharacterized protein [Rutidosis leptorrhynchoides]|uniref:uncharacterized protein n=1 Tax=Rutidosis leptorrhynchoides TaxID=125765 RepID=UPI003A98DB45